MLVKPADTRAQRLLSSAGTNRNFALHADMFILTATSLPFYSAESFMPSLHAKWPQNIFADLI